MAQRDTFAFRGNAPVQYQGGPSGQSRGASVEGGQSQGTAITSGPQTNANINVGGLGEFFNELMQPAVQRKQHERFVDGFTRAMQGQALTELSDSGSAVTQIFGPTSLAEGAQFYTAQTALAKYGSDQQANMDNLRKMEPAAVAKHLADQSVAMMTGDPYVDDMLGQGFLKMAGPLVDTVAKQRVVWQQGELNRTQAESIGAQGDLLQSLMIGQSKVSDPSDASNTAAASGVNTFLQSMQMLSGQTEESYKANLFSVATSLAQKGNGYAVEAMKSAGLWNVLDEDQQVKLEDKYQRYGDKAVAKAALASEYDMNVLDARIANEEISPMDAIKEAMRINSNVKGASGFNIDLFDYKDLRSLASGVTSVVIASARRRQDRADQLADRATTRQWQVEDREAERASRRADAADEEDRVTKEATTIWNLGTVRTGIAGGMRAKDFDILAANDIANGNFNNVVHAFEREGYVSPHAAGLLQNGIQNSIGDTYNKTMEKSVQQWDTMYKASAPAALAHYGKFGPMMQAFGTMRRGGMEPQAAFARAFLDPAKYSVAEIPREKRGAATKAVEAAVASTESSSWNPFGERLTASTRAAMVGSLTAHVAIGAQNTDLPVETIVSQQVQAMKADGTFEVYGRHGWRNKPGTVPLSRIVGLQPKEMAATFNEVMDRNLKKSGYDDGSSGDVYDITRMTHQGKEVIHVIATDADGGGSKSTFIYADELKEVAQHRRDQAYSRTSVAAARDPAVRKRIKAYNDKYNPQSQRTRNRPAG